MTRPTANELYAIITDRIVADIEAGAGTWTMPWHKVARTGSQMSALGRRYNGINALWLGLLASDRGYTSGVWATYKQWKQLGAQVLKDEHETTVLLWKPFTRKDAEGNKVEGVFAKTFGVFAAEQCKGTEKVLAKLGRDGDMSDHNSPERIEAAERFFAAVGADVTEQGDRAYYSRSVDRIVVPPLAQFDRAEHFYSTLAHEHTHWTGHEDRLNRTFGQRFGDDAYAAEELVAELGAAYFAAEFGLDQVTRPDHSAYLGHWVRVLKSDPKALVTVASKAQHALDFLHTQAGIGEISAEAELAEAVA